MDGVLAVEAVDEAPPGPEQGRGSCRVLPAPFPGQQFAEGGVLGVDVGVEGAGGKRPALEIIGPQDTLIGGIVGARLFGIFDQGSCVIGFQKVAPSERGFDLQAQVGGRNPSTRTLRLRSRCWVSTR